jgi:hypothetical protein
VMRCCRERRPVPARQAAWANRRVQRCRCASGTVLRRLLP